MADHGNTDNVHTRSIAEFVSGLTYEQIPADVRERIKLLDARFARLRHLRRQSRMVPHPARHAGKARRDAHHLDLGHECAALLGPCGARQRHAGAGLRARRRAPQGGAACRRGHVAGADRGGGEPRQLSGRDFLTAAVAGYEIGPRVGLCMGQEHIGQGWHSGATVGIFSAAAGRRARAGARCGQDRACARHRRHAIVRPDGRAIRRHGQAHACRTRSAERTLWRAAGERRLHRHRRRVRGALWRLLHDIFALAGPLQSR